MTNEKNKASHRESPSESAAKDGSTRELLLKGAAKVFADKGYEGATVKELADVAGVNISLVSYYFGGKEGLYRECLEAFGRERLATAERVLKRATSAEDFRLRLSMFAEEFIRANLVDKDRCKILHRDFDMGMNPIAMEVFRTSILPVYMTLVTFVTEAQRLGLVREDVEAPVATGMFFGSLVHTIKTDPIRQMVMNETIADEAVLEKTVQNYIRIFTEGMFQRGHA